MGYFVWPLTAVFPWLPLNGVPHPSPPFNQGIDRTQTYCHQTSAINTMAWREPRTTDDTRNRHLSVTSSRIKVPIRPEDKIHEVTYKFNLAVKHHLHRYCFNPATTFHLYCIFPPYLHSSQAHVLIYYTIMQLICLSCFRLRTRF